MKKIRKREKRTRRATFGFPPSFIKLVDKYIDHLSLPAGERAPSRTDILIRGTTSYIEAEADHGDTK